MKIDKIFISWKIPLCPEIVEMSKKLALGLWSTEITVDEPILAKLSKLLLLLKKLKSVLMGPANFFHFYGLFVLKSRAKR